MGKTKSASSGTGKGGGGRGGGGKGSSSAASSSAAFVVAPKGPPGPLLPSPPKLSRKRDLRAEEVGDNAWIVRGVLDRGEASQMVDAADARGYQHATSRGPRFGEAHRNHGRAGYEDPALAASLWRDTGLDVAVAAAVGTIGGRSAVGLNPSLRVYRYAVGEVFGAHYDEAAVTPIGGTELTLLCYLTGKRKNQKSNSSWEEWVEKDEEREELEMNPGTVVGGETAFYRDAHDGARELFRVAPEEGAVLIFRHGAVCLPHASLAVVNGKKVVLRSDVAFR